MRTCLLGVLLLAASQVSLCGGDWPMWRHDVERSAASPDGVVDNPVLLWSLKLPPMHKAWPLERKRRLDFDASYEPVVMGKQLFLASPVNGSVAAYDTDSGAEQWTYFTEGPIRCAPVCWKDRVFVGSDDGCLYCLDSASGRLLWRFRGAPRERPDKRLLGNGHLISFWPVRGGPVVKDGVLYFGAGIWPVFGVFYYALDAGTGAVKWVNRDLNHIENVRIDHERKHDVGLSPQGHFLIAANRLVVPNGRSMPAGLELETGRIIYYAQGYRNGDGRVTAGGDTLFVGKTGVVDLYDFREAGSKWAGTGPKGPDSPGRGRDGYESPYFPYKLAKGCDASSAFDGGLAYASHAGAFYAYDIAHAERPEVQEDSGMKVGTFRKWKPPLLWEHKTQWKGRSEALAKAGNRVYGHVGSTLVALENLEAVPRVAWSCSLDGTPSSIIAADDKLFVATVEGMIHCLGKGPPVPKAAVAVSETVEQEDTWQAKAAELVKTTGVRSGYCIVQGIGSGRLIEALIRQTGLTILAVDADREKVRALQQRLAATGLLGSRAELFVGRPFEFGFPPYIASLVISERGLTAEELGAVDLHRTFHSLRPYGGTLVLELPGDAEGFGQKVEAAKLPKAAVRQDGNDLLVVREGALPGSDQWTHEPANAARTFFSRDDRVRAPLGFLWFGDENGFVQYNDYGLGAKPQINGGRLFALHQRAKKLFAYDVYTGRPLWTAPMGTPLARAASMDDGVYLASNGKCVVYDPETGDVLGTMTFDADGKAPHVKDIRVDGDVVLIAFSEEKTRAIDHGYWDSTYLACFDRKSRAELWRRQAKDRFNNASLAIGDGIVFCVDSVSMAKTARWLKRTDGKKETESVLYAVDARSGAELWTARMRTLYASYGPSGWTSIRGKDDWVGYSADTGIVLFGRSGKAGAYKAKTGTPIWRDKKVGMAPVIIRDDNTFLTQGFSALGRDVGYAYDLLTGEPGEGGPLGRRIGCNYAVASRHLVMSRDATVSYTDVESEKVYHLRGTRSGCSASLVAADGVLNVPNFAGTCVCNYPIVTSFAMITMPEVAEWSGEPVSVTAPPATIHKGGFVRLGPIRHRNVKLPELLQQIQDGAIDPVQKWELNDNSVFEWVAHDPERRTDGNTFKVKLYGDDDHYFVVQTDIRSHRDRELDVVAGPDTVHGVFLNHRDIKGKGTVHLTAGVNRLAMLVSGGQTVFLRPADPAALEAGSIRFEAPAPAGEAVAMYSPPAGKQQKLRLLRGWRVRITSKLPKAKTMHTAHPDPGMSVAARAAVQTAFDDTAWETVDVPKAFENYGKQWADVDGEVVYRLTVDIPEAWAGKALLLSFGAIDDFDETFWNGRSVGKTDKSVPFFYSVKRQYAIPASQVKAGRNVIAVRMFDRFGSGGMMGPADKIYVELEDAE